MKAHHLNLLHALNAAAAALQRSARSEAEVYRACQAEISALGLRGGLSLLDQAGERLEVRATVQPHWLSQAMSTLERHTGYTARGYAFPVTKVETYRQVLETCRAIFVQDSSFIVREMLPGALKTFAGPILKILGAPPAIYAPLVGEGRAIGVLNVVGAGLTPDDVPAVEAFANHIAIALDNARLFEALRNSEQRFRSVVNNIPIVLWAVDGAGEFTLAEGKGLQAMNLVPGRSVGQSAPELYARVPQIAQDSQRALAGESVFSVFQVADATFEAQHFPLLGPQDEIVGAIGIAMDVTERKRVEVEREKLIVELEQRNAELERFTYTVSHDLKSPLVTVRGFLGYVKQDARKGNWERLDADLARIVEATDKMQRLLDELLELSRIGRLINPPQDVAFEAIAREALDLVHGRLAARGVQVELEAELPMVHGDRARLVEVLQNLLDNAVKFMGNQPEPRVTIGSSGTDRDGKPILFVRDNGVGIDPQYHEKVFGLFDKLDPRSDGTGIGLALVKRIVEVHGGRIWLKSEGLATGSIFYFTLPPAAGSGRSSVFEG